MGEDMTGRQFTRARKVLWPTQREAAAALGVAQTTVAKWETGVNKVPRPVIKLMGKLLEELK
jgi:DNA-binding transcriptional regulator YiaG